MQIQSRIATAIGTILAAAVLSPQVAGAQEAAATTPTTGIGGLEEIVVTAQRREQSQQTVPVAVTAIAADVLTVNRVASVMDLASLAPGLMVITTIGGASIPSVTMRGSLSQAGTAGTNRAIGYYVDGIPIGPGLGQSFEIPGVLRSVEVLRGPQGTLFGRNSSAGAITLSTLDPSGEFGLHQTLSGGNYDQFRTSTRVETPTFGPFSALVSYTHDERTGDIKNTGAGAVWDRTAFNLGKSKSAKTLGDKNQESVFAAVKFAPSDNFTMVAKFDWTRKDFTPEGSGLAAFTSTNPTLVAMFNDAVAAGRVSVAGPSRPDSVNNEYTTPTRIENYGASLTTTWVLSDRWVLKNILGYRDTEAGTMVSQDGLGGLRAAPNTPFVVLGGNNEGGSNQWSVEQQVFYDGEAFDLTAGGMYYKFEGAQGGPIGISTSPFFATFPNFTWVPDPTRTNRPIYQEESYAGYAQVAYHATSALDIDAGVRVSHDKKTNTTYIGTRVFSGEFSSTEPTYLIGANYRLAQDVMAYAKFSTGYLAGGSVGPLPFKTETSESWELGLKSQFLDNRVRLNIALYDVKYKDLQVSSFGFRVGRPEFGVIVANVGALKSKGFEAEMTAQPVNGLTVNANLGYSDNSLTDADSPLLVSPGQTYVLPLHPDWTAALGAQYESNPVFGDARVMARLDGNWMSKIRQIPRDPVLPAQKSVAHTPAGWFVNGRVALRDIEVASGRLEVALWGKNLLDNDNVYFTVNTGDFAAVTYAPARTYGLEVVFDY